MNENASLLLSEDNERVVKKNFQITCAIGANLMLVCVGISSSASGFLIPQLEDPTVGFGITTDDGSWIASILEIGSLSGAIFGGLLSEKLGRRRSLMTDSVFFLFGTLLTAFSINLNMIMVGRFIQGHSATSALVTAPLYTCEISQPKVRRFTALLPVLCWDIGIAVSYLLGALLPWRHAIGLTTIFPIASFALLMICPESPTWFIAKDKEIKAKDALVKLRGVNNMDVIEKEFGRILANQKLSQDGFEKSSTIKDKLKMMFDLSVLIPFGILFVLTIGGMLLCGLTILTYFFVPLLLEAKIPLDSYWTAAFLVSYRAILSVFTLPFIGNLEKRKVHFVSGAFLILGLLSLSISTYLIHEVDILENYPMVGWIPIISILFIYTSEALGWESIIVAFQGELLPVKARSLGIGVLGFIESLISFGFVKSIPKMFDTLGIHGTFMMCACFAISTMIFSFFFMPETFGLTLEEIEDIYRQEKFVSEEKKH